VRSRRSLPVQSTNRNRRLLFVIACTALSFGWWDLHTAPALMIDRIVARVNDDVITLSELQEEGLPLFERLRENYTGKELEHQVQRAEREFLDQLVLKRLQLQYAGHIGITASENEINAAFKDVLSRNNLTQEQLVELLTREGLTLQDYKDRLREQIVLARLMNQAVRSRVSVDSSEVEAYYQAHQNEFDQPPQARVRHIFFRVEPGTGGRPQTEDVQARATRVLQEARNGGDFATLARRYSEDATAANGGDLGLIKRGDALPEFEEVIFNMKEGEISDIIRTPNGLHIVKVETFSKGSLRDFSEIKPEIERRLLQEKMEKRFQDWTNELKDKAFIEITLHEPPP
jgi:peptidyl-prolyl cis-trans isomerase SurA